MLGESTSVLASSIGRDAAAAAVAAPEGGGGSGDGSNNNSGEETFRGGQEELLGGGERSFGGNRWPRQETLALLQIRSEMDVAFRDASVKGPLWEEVSSKLAALGYHRSAKKCKEKFENVYKYHRRTKEGRTGKSEGKTYRFFDQLNALENQPPTPGNTTTHHQPKPHQSTTVAAAATMTTMAMANPPPTISHLNSCTTVPSSAAPHPTIPTVSSQGIATPTLNNLTLPSSFPPTNPIVLPPPPQPPPPQPTTTNPTSNLSHHHQQQHTAFPTPFPTIPTDLLSNSASSSTSSDEELEGRAKKKRKWKDFFERLMKDVIQKQEDLQKRFLETIEKREQERIVREEAWRMQEIARINREHEILAQERSIKAAKDAAVMSFLQKVSEQHQNQNQNQNQSTPNQSQQLPLQPAPLPLPLRQSAPPPQAQPQQKVTNFDIVPKSNNNGENDNLMMPPSSSRWPKVEVQALIKLRTSLDSKYQENGPKGPLWEEISGGMRKLGYNRNAKRCKEKWENINKYFKKVKESNKRRPEDSKTCPYFHLLDSLYRERNNFDQNNVNSTSTTNSSSQFKPENSVPLMVRPEQQWPPPHQQQDHQGLMMGTDHHQNQGEDHHDQQDKENNIGDDDDDEEDEEEEDEEEEDDDDEGDGNYEIVANKPASVGAATAE
ncbi:trihelix transcription factor DF1-like [Pyrus communis]|uniref:trihelix transcription factor DF1-like n=1 Tax=Pyrus communis TaxID=23211 RepID=UPI0035BED9EE